MIPISPVPARAIGPVYHVCDMLGTTIPNAAQKVNTAANPGGRCAAWSQRDTSYASHVRRKTKCSHSTIAAKMEDQYPITPVSEVGISEWAGGMRRKRRTKHVNEGGVEALRADDGHWDKANKAISNLQYKAVRWYLHSFRDDDKNISRYTRKKRGDRHCAYACHENY